MISTRIRLILSLLCCLSLSRSLTAQVRISDLKSSSKVYNEWGIIAGANILQLVAFPFVAAYSPGGQVGAYIRKRRNLFSLQGSLILSSAHYETTLPLAYRYRLSQAVAADKVSKGIFDAIYVNIPLVAEIRPAKHLGLQMGVSYSYLPYLIDNNDAYSQIGDAQKLFKKSNVSGVAGLELELSQKLKVAAGYSIGFMDVNNHTFQGLTDKWLVSSGNVSLVYRIKKMYPARMWQFKKHI